MKFNMFAIGFFEHIIHHKNNKKKTYVKPFVLCIIPYGIRKKNITLASCTKTELFLHLQINSSYCMNVKILIVNENCQVP